MRLLAALPVLTVLSLVSACSPPRLITCTLESRASVSVTVVDTQGNPQPDARVTFTRNGGPEQQALCLRNDQPSGCDAWVAEYEQPGEFLVTATSADGARKVQQGVVVDEDECHVLTQTVRLTLPD
jgi:hypothetical protein